MPCSPAKEKLSTMLPWNGKTTRPAGEDKAGRATVADVLCFSDSTGSSPVTANRLFLRLIVSLVRQFPSAPQVADPQNLKEFQLTDLPIGGLGESWDGDNRVSVR